MLVGLFDNIFMEGKIHPFPVLLLHLGLLIFPLLSDDFQSSRARFPLFSEIMVFSVDSIVDSLLEEELAPSHKDLPEFFDAHLI
mmetsp:Transcript_44622/g.43265  ORF Transcript_44622/g.43265 Transcript_44622/m.43265 type:complete len:84 (-) Transcript_44622:364-615(-)